MAGEVLGVAWGNFDSVKLSTKYFGDLNLTSQLNMTFFSKTFQELLR